MKVLVLSADQLQGFVCRPPSGDISACNRLLNWISTAFEPHGSNVAYYLSKNTAASGSREKQGLIVPNRTKERGLT